MRGEHAGQRHAAVVEHVGVVHDLVGAGVLHPRHVLDRELDAGQLALPAALDVLDGVEHQVVELLGAAAGQRHLGGHEATAQATAVPVAARGSRGGGMGWVIDGGGRLMTGEAYGARRPRVGAHGVIVQDGLLASVDPDFRRACCRRPPHGITVRCVRNRW